MEKSCKSCKSRQNITIEFYGRLSGQAVIGFID